MKPGLRLRLATSNLIRQWAQRKLPNGKKISGKILNSKTINYQTLKPEKDGLFCQRLFGPINDSICACGRSPIRGQKFCPRCEVEYISNRVRRYRLGYIQLVTAAAHIWFFKGRPNYFSLFLGLSKKKIECLLYCTQNISRTIFPKELENLAYSPYNLNLKKRNFANQNLNSFFVKRRFWKIQKNVKKFEIFIDFFEFFPLRQDLVLKNFIQNKKKFFIKSNYLKKSLWHDGGLRDSAIYFGFALISKMLSWHIPENWFSFVYFLIKPAQKGDRLNKFYAGKNPAPPGILNFWGFKSRLFCSTAVQLIRTWLTQLTQYKCNDGRLLEIQIRLDLIQERPLSDSDKDKDNDNEFLQKIQLFRRFKYLRCFRHTQMNPASMVLNVLPVLPPDLRPILQLDNNQIAISDFNKLYQTIIFRNRRLSRLTIDQNFHFHCLNSEALQYAQRLLQESVDSLIENGNDKQRILSKTKREARRPLKSLSDLFLGKKGRFRQNLLGKRVDYSGRSVIVVGPYLKIYECGLPKEIAYELFQPFLLRILMFQKKARTILGAKRIYQQKPQFLWTLLKEIVHSHPILLNRAPTLHRLSIQAFQPRFVEGKAILLHPLVCAAFNADFDGDQMGVHLPLCFEARAEAWKLIWSQNNLFSVATSAPICSPSQDMILGSSFLTTRNLQKYSYNVLYDFFKKSPQFIPTLLFKKPHLRCLWGRGIYSSNRKISNLEREEILSEINTISFSHRFRSSQLNRRELIVFRPQNQMCIWCTYNPILNEFETEKKRQKIIEIRLDSQGRFQKFRPHFFQQYHSSGAEMLRKIRTTYGRLKFYQNLSLF